jgi:hypothetical protein
MVENLIMLLSLKTTYRIPKDINVFKTYLKLVKAVSFNISLLGLSIYK